jgi:hypothetical protein
MERRFDIRLDSVDVQITLLHEDVRLLRMDLDGSRTQVGSLRLLQARFLEFFIAGGVIELMRREGIGPHTELHLNVMEKARKN